MTKTLPALVLLFACSCCEAVERDHHLRCTDDDGNVVIDTHDLRSAPMQNETAWRWKNADGSEYTEISVPPHKCVYEAKLMTFSEAPEAPPTWGED